MRYSRNTIRSLSGVIFLLGLALSFATGGFSLPIFFVTLAVTTFLGSLSTSNPRGVYGGLQGAFWMLGLAFCFLVGFWPWILVVAAASIILGTQFQSITNALVSMGLASPRSSSNQVPYYQPQPDQSPEQYYQQQPAAPPVQPYQQGYQPPAPPRESYQEGAGQYPYPPQTPSSIPQYEQPQSQYPQQMPPQQG